MPSSTFKKETMRHPFWESFLNSNIRAIATPFYFCNNNGTNFYFRSRFPASKMGANFNRFSVLSRQTNILLARVWSSHQFCDKFQLPFFPVPLARAEKAKDGKKNIFSRPKPLWLPPLLVGNELVYAQHHEGERYKREL